MPGSLFNWYKKRRKEPSIQFGRYSDNNKSLEKINAWALSDRSFREKKYPVSQDAFFEYLRDDQLDNVVTERRGPDLDFRIFQGSSEIRGSFHENNVIAEVNIARMQNSNVPVMRKLLEQNFNLFYCRYALDGERICMRFDSDIRSANPTKLYYSFKEMAIKADKQDDLLLREFTQLKAGNEHYQISLPDSEKAVKYNFLKKFIKETVQLTGSLDTTQLSGAIASLLSALAYRIDYLICPEGPLLQDLEKMISEFLSGTGRPTPENNQKMQAWFIRVSEIPQTELENSFYRTRSTFSQMPPPKPNTISEQIAAAIQNMYWYRDNQYPEIARQVLELGFTSIAFNYSLPGPLNEFLKLFMQLNYPEFFESLGFGNPLYQYQENHFHKAEIENEVSRIIGKWNNRYIRMSFNLANLNYENILGFDQSFLTEIQFMNLDVNK